MSGSAIAFVMVNAFAACLFGMAEPFLALPSTFLAFCIIADETISAIREAR